MGERDLEAPLAALQRFMTEAVRLPTPIADDAELARRVDAFVAPSVRGMRGAQRLDVYREQFWLRHLSSLRDDYPTLEWIIGGRDAFHQLATRYLCACPPRTWNLQKLGADLPSYVAGHPPWSEDVIATEAARLDWAFMEAFDAPDVPAFDPRVLGSAPEDAWAAARIGFHPSLSTMALAYPVHELRDAVKEARVGGRPAAEASRVVVWRDPACVLRAVAVEPLAFELLVALDKGAPLGEACEQLARHDASAVGTRVTEWFQNWTASGWISEIRFGA
jgi:hypothetical protein